MSALQRLLPSNTSSRHALDEDYDEEEAVEEGTVTSVPSSNAATASASDQKRKRKTKEGGTGSGRKKKKEAEEGQPEKPKKKVGRKRKEDKEREAAEAKALQEANDARVALAQAAEQQELGEKEEEEDDDSILDDDTNINENDTVKLRKLLEQFTPEQQSRYEYFRRSSFQRANIKKVMQTVSNNTTINQKMAIVMGGITKIFAGEVIESAKTIMDEWGDHGSLKPRHIREAYRKLKQHGKIPYVKAETQLFMK